MQDQLFETIRLGVAAGALFGAQWLWKQAIRRFSFLQKDIKAQLEKDIRRQVEIDRRISAELELLIGKFGFNRTSICYFHNGVTGFNGISFKNISMRYEATDAKTKEILNDYRAIPISSLNGLLTEIKDAPARMAETNDINGHVAALHTQFAVKQSYIFMIGDDLVDGLLMCDYTDEPKELAPADIASIKGSAARINAQSKIANLNLQKK